MQFELVSGSEGAAHALYDPGVVERPPDDAGDHAWDAWLDRQVTTGRMLYYYGAGDEELRLKLYVDEPFRLPPRSTKSGEVDGALLRVESGTLVLTGIDGLYTRGDGSGADDNDGGDPAPDHADVLPGTYRATAFRVDHHLSAARIEKEIAPQLEPGDARFAGRVDRVAVPVGCAVMLVSVLAAFAFLFAEVSGLWRFTAVLIALAVCAATAFVLARLFFSPRASRWQQAKDDLWKRYPPVVVVLRRLADGELPATAPSGRFGDAIEDLD